MEINKRHYFRGNLGLYSPKQFLFSQSSLGKPKGWTPMGWVLIRKSYEEQGVELEVFVPGKRRLREDLITLYSYLGRRLQQGGGEWSLLFGGK